MQNLGHWKIVCLFMFDGSVCRWLEGQETEREFVKLQFFAKIIQIIYKLIVHVFFGDLMLDIFCYLENLNKFYFDLLFTCYVSKNRYHQDI